MIFNAQTVRPKFLESRRFSFLIVRRNEKREERRCRFPEMERPNAKIVPLGIVQAILCLKPV